MFINIETFENLTSLVKQVIITSDCSLLFVFSNLNFHISCLLEIRMCSFYIYRNDSEHMSRLQIIDILLG